MLNSEDKMENNKISVVVFDLGNVLIPFDYSIAIQKLESIEKGLGHHFMEYYRQHYELHRSFERGDLPEEKFIEKMLEVLKHKIDAEAFCKYYSHIFVENKDVSSLLPEIKKNYSLVLLSNTNSIHQKYGWGKYEFLKYFDKLILSHEVNAVKPEQKIYKAVESFTGKPSSEHIFIDDVFEYVEGAKKNGWDSVQFVSYEKLVHDLKSRKILK